LQISSNRPLQQIHRKIVEREQENSSQPALIDFTFNSPFVNYSSSYSNSINSTYYKKYFNNNFKLGIGKSDSACQLDDGSIVIVKTFVQRGEEKLFFCQKFQQCISAFKTPCDSLKINISFVSSLDPIETYKISKIVKKIVLLPCGSSYFAVPLIHLS
jgi:hypothetical protein